MHSWSYRGACVSTVSWGWSSSSDSPLWEEFSASLMRAVILADTVLGLILATGPGAVWLPAETFPVFFAADTPVFGGSSIDSSSSYSSIWTSSSSSSPSASPVPVDEGGGVGTAGNGGAGALALTFDFFFAGSPGADELPRRCALPADVDALPVRCPFASKTFVLERKNTKGELLMWSLELSHRS